MARATHPDRSRAPRSRAVYATHRGLHLYDIATDKVTLLRRTADRTNVQGARFRTGNQVTYAERRVGPDRTHTFGQDSLYEIDPATRQVTELLRLPNKVLAHDWSPDGQHLAYQMRVESRSRVLPLAICVYDSIKATTSLIRRLESPIGTGLGQREEESIAWSPDGKSILSVNTPAQPSIHVLSPTGKELTTPRNGTFARWLHGGKGIMFQQEPSRSDERGRWARLLLRDGELIPLGVPAGTFRPSVSPNGNLIAFDDGSVTGPALFVHDIESGITRRVLHGYAGAIWLETHRIAATAAGGHCPQRTECNDWWHPINGRQTIALDMRTRLRQQLTLGTTFQPRTSSIDVYLAP